MAYKLKQSGDYRKRRNFSMIKNSLAISDLLEVQTESYKWFASEGIKEVFETFSPIESFSGSLSLEFGEYEFGTPRYSIKECKDRQITYASPLKVQTRLFNNETGEVKEQEIFLGDMPLMTDSGTFIINGAERVVVSQLVRSPSVYFSKEIDKNGKPVFASKVIPSRGTWLEYETDAKDVVYIRIDRNRKVPMTTLLRAVGLSSNEDILTLFDNDVFLKNTIEKDSTHDTDEALIEIYEKLRPGEPTTLDSSKNQLITRFFDDFHYDLARVGRYKFNKKLNVKDRLLGNKLAEDIIIDGEVKIEKGTLINKEVFEELSKYLDDGYGVQECKVNEDLTINATVDVHNKIQVIHLYSNTDDKKIVKVIGNDPKCECKNLTISDFYATVSYYLNLNDGIGKDDEIDHLGNRRVKQVGELLQNQFKIGVSRMERVIRERMTTQDIETVTPKTLINIRPVTAVIKEFFGSSQLSQFMDQTNPIAELTHKRRLSALGPGGLSRDRAGIEVRDVNASHYGRICPIESPEGANIGLITSLASYAKINEYGFIMTPYRKVVNGHLTDEVVYLTADEEEDYYISQATVNVDDDNKIVDNIIAGRYRGENVLVSPDKVDYIDVSPQQVVSVTTSLIPFLEHDDATRALMGANMQRQALPLLTTEAPFVGTGAEYIAARDSGSVIVAKADGIVSYVDAKKIVVKNAKGEDVYYLAIFERSNQGETFNHVPIVREGDKVKRGQIIADGPSTDKGELALGKNVVVAFTTFNGYNYEDAVIMNERLVIDDVYTSLHIEDYEVQCRDTKLGPEEITRDIPNVGEDARKNLDENGIVRIGTEVKEGDVYHVRYSGDSGDKGLNAEYVYITGTGWELLGPVVDLSAYYTKTETDSAITKAVGDAKTEITSAYQAADTTLQNTLQGNIDALYKVDGESVTGIIATRISAVETKADSNETTINTLKGDENTIGSVAKAIKDKIDSLDSTSSVASASDAKGGYVYSVSQTDGKVAVKTANFSGSVDSEDTNAVTGGAVATYVTGEIAKLDVADIGSAGSFISVVGETDGKVHATATAFATALDDNTTVAPQAKVVKAYADSVYDAFGSVAKGDITALFN